MGRTMYNIKEHNRIKMPVIVLNVRTPLIDKNTCAGLKIIYVKSVYLLYIYLLFNFSSHCFALCLSRFIFSSNPGDL